MQKELGNHPNSVVLYPTGAPISNYKATLPGKQNGKPYTVAFAGNLGDWYGGMLEALVEGSEGTNIAFKIFGSNASWSKDFDQYATAKGIYKGQVSFEVLKAENK